MISALNPGTHAALEPEPPVEAGLNGVQFIPFMPTFPFNLVVFSFASLSAMLTPAFAAPLLEEAANKDEKASPAAAFDAFEAFDVFNAFDDDGRTVGGTENVEPPGGRAREEEDEDAAGDAAVGRAGANGDGEHERDAAV